MAITVTLGGKRWKGVRDAWGETGLCVRFVDQRQADKKSSCPSVVDTDKQVLREVGWTSDGAVGGKPTSPC